MKFGQHKRYQDWFQRQYLATPESQSLRCDLIRYICAVIHPSNEVLCSDIIPRWAVIGWLLTTCTVSRARTSTDLWNRLIVSVKPVHNRLTFYFYVVGRRCPIQLKEGLISLIVPHTNVCCHLQESSTPNLAQYEISCEICIATMAAPLWRLICQTKSDCIQVVAQELVKILIFYIYMDLHIKVFIFVLEITFSGFQTTKLQIFRVRKYSIFITVNE